MRMMGYCDSCRKVKTVRVARLMNSNMQIGTCIQCEDAADLKAKESRKQVR